MTDSDSSSAVRALRSSEWEPFLSPNSRPDSCQETFEITGIEVEGRTLRATCRMVSYQPRQDGSWHFRGAVAVQMSSELKRIHAHVINGLEKREFTALLTSLKMDFRRIIEDPEHIEVELRITDEQTTERGGIVTKRYTWEFDFCEGSFVCESKGHYRRATDSSVRPEDASSS